MRLAGSRLFDDDLVEKSALILDLDLLPVVHLGGVACQADQDDT